MEADHPPATVTSCNCSICHRLGALWAYYTRAEARLVAGQDQVVAYLWGDREIEFYHCRTCGSCTHYEVLAKDPTSRFTINGRCFTLEDLKPIKVRHLDGADTWTYLD